MKLTITMIVLMRSIPPFIAIVDSVYAMLVLGLNCNGIILDYDLMRISLWVVFVKYLMNFEWSFRSHYVMISDSNRRVIQSSTSEEKLFIYVIIVESVH